MRERPKKADLTGILSDIEAATFTPTDAAEVMDLLVSNMAIGSIVSLRGAAAVTGLHRDTVRKYLKADKRVVEGTYNDPKTGHRSGAYKRAT